MFDKMIENLRETAISEAVEICEKSELMDSAMFYHRIKNMTIEEISQISMDIVLTHNIKELNRNLVVTKHKSILRKVM